MKQKLYPNPDVDVRKQKPRLAKPLIGADIRCVICGYTKTRNHFQKHGGEGQFQGRICATCRGF